MKVRLDERRDEATIEFSEERQSKEGGATYLVVVNDEKNPAPRSIEVQLGFEGYERLLFMIVRPASKALPSEVLDSAERV